MPKQTDFSPSHASASLKRLADIWSETDANERASFQPWLIGFCEALGVAPPVPPTDDYRFELAVRMVDREGRESTNFIDCWKAGHFALEAKASGAAARDDALLRKAFGQVRNYVAHVSGDVPPYLMVVDVPRTLIVWDRWSGAYGDYAGGRHISLGSLHERPDDVALLYDIFARPAARDPRGKAQAVTTQIAARLAELSAELESRGFDTERVARFLMRCVFSCFAEDVGLLPDQLFRRTLETARASGDVMRLGVALTSLWNTMDAGGMFGAELLHRFNGHFFKTVESLPLEARDVELLIDAARHDWSRVEPSIFGTLLVRAIDPEERHRLGAEYTPRAYIERLVEPTVVEPIRERWTAVQAAVLQLEESSKKRDKTAAVKLLRDFHEWMRGLSFLDPACGSGNFLYVTMIAVKRIELEVLNEIQRLSGGQGGLVLDEVHPRQFHGIEVKPWAREIAELTLWIGYHQFWRETHGGRTPPDPILEDTGTIECRDAVLAWDAIVHRPEKDRPDPAPRVRHQVTGELVPDPNAKLKYYEYVGARQTEWPEADFIVGNPPYMGEKRQRDALGDGYVDALRQAYSHVSSSADLVMYWWVKAASYVIAGATVRSGLITTNSITQSKNRSHIARATSSGAHVIWAAPNHPWVDEVGGAAVRVAMTVLARQSSKAAQWYRVNNEGEVIEFQTAATLGDDLSPGVDVSIASSVPLEANTGLAHQGFKIGGTGFMLTDTQAHEILSRDTRHVGIVRPTRNARDLAARSRNMWVIDLALADEAGAREVPLLYDHLRSTVFAERQANARESYRRYWWRFLEPRRELRAAVEGLPRYLATPEVSKYRFFVDLPSAVAPDGTLVVIALSSAEAFGILSSRVHEIWALAVGGRLGVGNDPRYNKGRCFDAFPFPAPNDAVCSRIAILAERLDAHRNSALLRDERITITGIYNVVAKLRSGETLNPKDRTIHEIAACGVLRDLHDELDALVAEGYGWPWPMANEEILERLVTLHGERVEEEKRGLVRWLRPDYQLPRFGSALPTAALDLSSSADAKSTATERRLWPASVVEQVAALGDLVAQRGVSPDEATATFEGARRDLVVRHLETLALMGEVTIDADGRYRASRKVA